MMGGMDLIDLLEYDDLFSLFLLLIVIYWAGQIVVRGSESARRWGLWTGVLTLISWLVRHVWLYGVNDAAQLAGAACRGVIAGGIVGSVVAVVMTGCGFMLGGLQGWWSSWHNWWRRWVDESARRRAEAATERQRRLSEREYERNRPEREREEKKRRASEKRQRNREEADQARREAKELELRLLFDRHRRELGTQLPSEDFESYFQSFLTNAVPPDEYEQRADQVAQMIRDLARVTGRPQRPQFNTIDDVLDFYSQQVAAIQKRTDLDVATKQTLISHLEDARDRALESLLQ
ncbi:MAG: hypothetical protein R3C18_06990 [Planctomycetaceae bacterium]